MLVHAEQQAEKTPVNAWDNSAKLSHNPFPAQLMKNHEQLQTLANQSQRVYQLKETQRLADSFSSSAPIQLKWQKIVGSGNVSGMVEYTPAKNNGVDSAYAMSAKNIKLVNANNKQLAGNNSPAADPEGWTELQALKLTKNAPFYKRMHLLNGELGGHGTKVENLAPGSADLNAAHSNDVEDVLQKHVLGGGEILTYDVFATYRKAGLQRFSVKNANTYLHTLESLHCQYQLDNGKSDALQISEGPKTAKAWP